MECCYPPCGECTVTPMLIASGCVPNYCEEEPTCYPCLPRCQKPVQYVCCEQKPPRTPPRCPVYERECQRDCCPQRECCPPARCCSPRRERRHEPRHERHERHEHSSAPEPSYEHCCPPPKQVKTKYIIPCYRYEDGRIVRRLPVSAFKRNGMQDQEHSKLLGTANFLVRCPRDVSIECEVRVNPVKVADPAKVPCCETKHALGCNYLRKKPIETNQPTVLMRRACEVACGTRARRKPFVVSSYAVDADSEIRRYHSEDERGNCCFHFERNKSQCNPPCTSLYQPCMSCTECQYVDCVYAQPSNTTSCCYYCK